MKKKYILPFALTAGFAALSGCGGESANVLPEPKSVVYKNGSCVAGKNCVEFALDYPVDGLNFTCSSDRSNIFITMIADGSNAATGKCTEGDTIRFFLQADKGVKTIELGTVPLADIGVVSTVSSSLPRLSILDMAKGVTGKAAQTLDPSDETVRVALAIAKIFQSIGVEDDVNVAGDVQPISLSPIRMDKLENILSSISTEDLKSGAYLSKIRPWTDASSITDDQAFSALKILTYMVNSALYQADIPVFSTDILSTGLYGCNKTDCKSTDPETQHIIGSFVVLVDRQGYAFGTGSQWRGKVDASSASSILGATGSLIKTRPERLSAMEQSEWTDPLSKRIVKPFKFSLDNAQAEAFTVTQGKVYNDFAIAGAESFYKALTKFETGKPEDYGLWTQKIGTDQFKGSFDAYKYFAVGFLDRKVFKSANNVAIGEKYVFPLYATLSFKLKDNSDIKMPVVVDALGNISTDFTSDTDWAAACAPVNGSVKQYRIGTLGATDLEKKSVTFRLLLSNPVFGKLDGIIVGANTQLSTGTAEKVVVGGSRLNIEQLVNGSGRFISATDFSGGTIQWTNTYNAMLYIYSKIEGSKLEEGDKEKTDITGGTMTAALSSCYKDNQVRTQ